MPALGEIATALNLELRGDPARPIDALAPLEKASPEHLTFVSEKRHLSKLSLTQAGAVILHPDWVDQWSGCALLSDTPYVAYAKATQIFDNHPAAAGCCARSRGCLKQIPNWGLLSQSMPAPMSRRTSFSAIECGLAQAHL